MQFSKKSPRRIKKTSKSLYLGIFFIIVSVFFYGVYKYYLPKQRAVAIAEQQQNQQWLSAFNLLNLTAEQEKKIKALLKKFDDEKHLSQQALAKQQIALNRKIRSHVSREEKLQEANKRMALLLSAMIELKKIDFYHLRKIYFTVLTSEQRTTFLRENPVILQPKIAVVKKIQGKILTVFAALDLTSRQKAKLKSLVRASDLVSLSSQREIINYRLYAHQFLQEIDNAKINVMFASLLAVNIKLYKAHRSLFEKITTQVLTEKQRKILDEH